MGRRWVCLLWWMLLGVCATDVVDNTISQLDQQDTLSSVLNRLDSLEHSLHQRLDSLDSRINDLGERVAVLLQQQQLETSKVLTDLKAVCDDLDQTADTLTTGPDQTKSVTSATDDLDPTADTLTQGPDQTKSVTTSPVPSETKARPFRITRVTKTHYTTTKKYKIRVEYEASGKPLVLLRTRYSYAAPLDVDHQPLGVIEVEIPEPSADNEDVMASPFISFTCSGESYGILLNLQSKQQTATVPQIRFESSHGRGIKYNSLSSTPIDLSYYAEENLSKIRYGSVYFQLMTKSLSEANVVDRFHPYRLNSQADPTDRVWLSFRNATESHGQGQVVVTINSTMPDPEGVINIYASFQSNCSEPCLVERFYRGFDLKFYREDHDGPFPKDFTGFVHDKYKPKTVSCSVGQPDCAIYCEAIGSVPVTVSLWRQLADGRLVSTDDIRVAERGGTWGMSTLSIINASHDDAGDYLCRATTSTKEISQAISLVVAKYARIDTNASHAVRLENGSVMASCIALGSPRPNVTFPTEYRSLTNLSPDDYVTAESHPSQSTTRVDLFIPDANYIYSLPCKASNTGPSEWWRYDTFYIEVIDAEDSDVMDFNGTSFI